MKLYAEQLFGEGNKEIVVQVIIYILSDCVESIIPDRNAKRVRSNLFFCKLFLRFLCAQSKCLRSKHARILKFKTKAWFKRRILHAPNQILILVDSNEYIRLI